MTIVPLGCPPPIADEMLPASTTHPMRFLYAGPFSVRKGAHYLLKAWESVGAVKDAELHIYGQQCLPERLLKGTKAENVVVHGPVSKEELASAYRESAVLVFPTLCDGFGMVAMEAFAHGLPVVISSNAGAADLVEEGKNGFVISPRDVDGLAARIEWCMGHPVELLEMRRYALATAKRWTWSEFRAGFLAQSSRVLGNAWI
jgi:glycosyltransferase involved in cell wall biosynthesis